MNLRIDFGLKINRVTADTQPECRMPMKYNKKDVLPQREGIFSIYSQKPGQFRPCFALNFFRIFYNISK